MNSYVVTNTVVATRTQHPGNWPPRFQNINLKLFHEIHYCSAKNKYIKQT